MKIEEIDFLSLKEYYENDFGKSLIESFFGESEEELVAAST